MREYIALEIVKTQQKKVYIDEFIDSLGIEDVEFRNLLKEYMYPLVTETFLKKGFYEQKTYEIVLTEDHRHYVEIRRHYKTIRAKLVTLITNTTASDLSLLQIIDAMKSEFEAFKTTYAEFKETTANGKELWLQFARFNLLRQYFSDIITYNEWDHNPSIQEYEELLLSIDDLAKPFGVDIDSRRQKRYNVNTTDGAAACIDDMVMHLDIVLSFLHDALRENKFKYYKITERKLVN